MSEEKKKNKSEVMEWTKAIVIAVILVFIIRQFIFAPVVVKGDSMDPTLKNGDRMIVNKFNYLFGNPKRFDIIVFHAPDGSDYIKRVIGLPGDTIEYVDDVLYINGEPFTETYLNELKSMNEGSVVTGDFQVESIPEGHIFVLGDNRLGSTDSRDIGPVAISEVVGKTNMIFWPFSNMQIVK